MPPFGGTRLSRPHLGGTCLSGPFLGGTRLSRPRYNAGLSMSLHRARQACPSKLARQTCGVSLDVMDWLTRRMIDQATSFTRFILARRANRSRSLVRSPRQVERCRPALQFRQSFSTLPSTRTVILVRHPRSISGASTISPVKYSSVLVSTNKACVAR